MEDDEGATAPQTAVLLSAGLDSAVLAAVEARSARIHPIYVSTGLAWEAAERAALTRLLANRVYRNAAPLMHLRVPVDDVYPSFHWALRGQPPAFDAPDEDVYLTGRNIILLSKAAIYCALHDISRVAIGPLAGNPFPDATRSFFDALQHALTLGLAHTVTIATPLADKAKSDVIRWGVALGVPLELTLSCMDPGEAAQHCGQCNKCRERREAFRDAGLPDPTSYVVMARTDRV